MNKLIITLMTLVLSACGGGSGGSESQSNTNAVTSSSSTAPATTSTSTTNTGETTAAQPQGEGMDSMDVDVAFDFKSNVAVEVTLSENVVSERAFINICKQGESLTNADNCFLRAPLDSNGFTTQIQLPHADQKLKAEIWFYSTSKEPLVYNWEVDASQQTQTWVIN
ncbi:hypothetical protein J8M21_11110 [Pseudoalteromonas luteoviolacea]|uniref:hypothetical protein n=1 Tax=Pseudoalteromonas luteoviolacea TaxID=43657 RepID=UPI001B3A4488|nr:hypothetical protein [Pseudoalteromonas luteoviolacea]MBQ4877756.1 hypothetical protein [Pseudoalteromonas luteoviolacea]MBQ4906798.1 hypothetical protein [Pseudoalteromonas luteoviolacea]